MAVLPRSPLYSSWSWSCNSNVQYVDNMIIYQLLTSSSIANDRAWFTDYIPFSSFTGESYSNEQQSVVGIGTVVLHTHCTLELYPRQDGMDSNATLTLKHVLHVPSARCNTIGRSRDFLDEYLVQMSFDDASKVTIKTPEGRTIAYFDSNPTVDARWSESEQARYTALQSRCAKRDGRTSAMSEEEQAWLTRYYGSEAAFLQNFGLCISKEEEREEGRKIMAYVHGIRRPNE